MNELLEDTAHRVSHMFRRVRCHPILVDLHLGKYEDNEDKNVGCVTDMRGAFLTECIYVWMSVNHKEGMEDTYQFSIGVHM